MICYVGQEKSEVRRWAAQNNVSAEYVGHSWKGGIVFGRWKVVDEKERLVFILKWVK